MCFELRNEPLIFHSQKEHTYVLRAEKWTMDLSLSKRRLHHDSKTSSQFNLPGDCYYMLCC